MVHAGPGVVFYYRGFRPRPGSATQLFFTDQMAWMSSRRNRRVPLGRSTAGSLPEAAHRLMVRGDTLSIRAASEVETSRGTLLTVRCLDGGSHRYASRMISLYAVLASSK